MRCDDVRRALSVGEMGAGETRSVEAHLGDCAECRRFRRALRGIEEEVAAFPASGPPPDLADRIRAALREAAPGLPLVPPPGKDRAMPRILVVDDEPNIVRLIQVNLERAGYQVETAFNGAQALSRVHESRPDLLVSDVMMPEMDGFELLSTIRKDPGLWDLPVIMLTAKVQDEDILRGYQRGADMYLGKPFNPRELVQFVRRIFAAMKEGDAEAYRI